MNRTLTITQLRLIIWNPDTYPPKLVRSAAIHILASFNATQEDHDRAISLL